jgi:hypothetical protein
MTYYVQAARGFRSGAPNQALAYDPNGPCGATAAADGVRPLTDPDTLWTYELGLKSTWADKRIAANIALFHQNWRGVQLHTRVTCTSYSEQARPLLLTCKAASARRTCDCSCNTNSSVSRCSHAI